MATDPTMLRDAAACVDEALHVYRTSTTAWETATSYFRPSESAHPQVNEISDPGIRHHSAQSLPPTFISQYSNVKYKSFMGLFPQINRAWLTVDSNLFLWAYTPLGQTTPASDLYVYEGLSQIIVSVALVKPRPGVFVESVRYLIAVATTVEVTLLGVTFSSTGQLNLVPTQISIPTDNTIMLKILSSDDGRLFMAGADGGLHQFEYNSKQSSSLFDLFSTRPRKRARKIAHSSSIASYLLPTPIKSWFSSQNELVDLVIESNSLFTLSQAGLLTVYDISDSQVRMIATSNISADAKHLFNFSVSPSDREFVSIHPVTASASSSVQLIVVTSLGERIYYSTRSSAVASALHPHTRPTSLRCLAYRPSPDPNISRSSKPCVHISWCHRGAAILADLNDVQSDRLMCIYPDVHISSPSSSQPSSNRDSGLMNSSTSTGRMGEVIINLNLDDANVGGIANGMSSYHSQGMYGAPSMTPRTPNTVMNGSSDIGSATTAPNRTFAIAEAVMLGSENEYNGMDVNSLNSGVSMPMDPPYFFWVLTSTAIHLYERVNAMDRLADILAKYNSNHEVIRKFFDRYGVADACAMCIEIGILNPSLQRIAANVFYTAGGSVGWNRSNGSLPGQGNSSSGMRRRLSGGGMDGTENSLSFQNRFDVGRAAVQAVPMTRFSGAHDGITLYLAKVLHPIWNNHLTIDRNINVYQDLSDSKELLTSVRDQLLAVSGFLERFSPEDLLPKVKNAEDEQRLSDGGGNRMDNQSARRNRNSHDRRLFNTGFGGGSGTDGQGGGNDEMMGDRVVHGLYELKRTEEARRLESNAIKGLVKLAFRAAEALALISVVDDHQLNRVMMVMSDIGKHKLIQARWHDFIANNEEGNIIASSLIEGMFSLYDDESIAMSSLGRILQEQCTGFFGNVDEELHKGLAFLRHAVAMYNECGMSLSEQGRGFSLEDLKSITGWSTAMSKADEAVTVLKRVAANIFDMRNVFDELKRIGAIAGMVDIGLAIGTNAEQSKKEQRKEEAFQQVLDVVEEMMKEKEGTGALVDTANGMVDNAWTYDEGVREASMRLALNCKSEDFLQRLYGKLKGTRKGLEMLTKEWDANVEKYLMDNEALETLWKYYAQHGRHFEAAAVLLKLAETGSVSLADRLNFLSCALLNAKTATSKGDERASGLLVELTDFLDVAKVQVRIRDELDSLAVSDLVSTRRNCVSENAANHNSEIDGDECMNLETDKEKKKIEQAMKELDKDILSLTLLFNKYARRFHLLECCLECLRCGSYRDDKYVRQVWREIVRRETARTESRRLVAQNLEIIGRQFYPSEIVMPIDYLVEILEVVNLQVYRGEDQNWGINVMRGMGVPLTDLVDGYRKLVERGSGGGRMGGQRHASNQGNSYKDHIDAAMGWGDENDDEEGNGWESMWAEGRGQLHMVVLLERVLKGWVDELVSEGGKLVGESEKAVTMRVSELGKSRLRGISRTGNDMIEDLFKRFEVLEQRMNMLVP